MAENKQPSAEKLKALQAAMAKIDKNFGKGAIMKLGDENIENVAVIPTGSIGLNLALGVGGYPKGRIIEIYGPESSGKTTLAIHAMAESGEQALDIADELIRSAAVDLIVIDSVAALTPKAEIAGDMGDNKVGLQARLMSQALRKMTASVNKTGTTVIFINQLREKIGVMFGNPETTTGGNALKFYASVRLDIRRTGQIKDGEQIKGNQVRVKVVKNKVAPPFKKAEFDLMFNEGISRVGEILDFAVATEIIKKSGSFFSYGDTKLGQGRDNVKAVLADNPDLCDELEAKVTEKVKELGLEVVLAKLAKG